MTDSRSASSTTRKGKRPNSEWRKIDSAPWGVVVEVRNELMDEPCLATRGYVYNGAVHENRKFFTTVYTPHRYFPTPAGQLVCPSEWRPRQNDCRGQTEGSRRLGAEGIAQPSSGDNNHD